MSATYKQAPGIPARNVEGVMAIITPRSSDIHRLNATASAIWHRCEEGATRSELVEDLLGQFEAQREQIEADVDHFLTDAIQKGILITS